MFKNYLWIYLELFVNLIQIILKLPTSKKYLKPAYLCIYAIDL